MAEYYRTFWLDPKGWGTEQMLAFERQSVRSQRLRRLQRSLEGGGRPLMKYATGDRLHVQAQHIWLTLVASVMRSEIRVPTTSTFRRVWRGTPTTSRPTVRGRPGGPVEACPGAAVTGRHQ